MIKEIKVNTEFIKLDQFLKWIGAVENGVNAKEIISSGQVFLNGEPVKERGKKIRQGDIVKIIGIGEFRCI